MPVATPNLVANPVKLENFAPVGIIRECSPSDILQARNLTGNTLLCGEPIIFNGLVCISSRIVLPGAVGNFYKKWIADFKCVMAADVLANALIYWNVSLNLITTGSGGAQDAAPINGFILGRALLRQIGGMDSPLNGSNKDIAAKTGAGFVRVASVPVAPTTYGTLPTYT